MTILLHYLPGSPYAWRIHLALEHKGIAYDLKTVDVGAGEHRSDAYAAMNPRRKIPVMRDGDFTLYESAAIVEYLEEAFPDSPRLLPEGDEERARVRRLVCEVDNYWFPATMKLVRNLYYKSNEADWDEDEVSTGTTELLSELAHFEGELRGNSFADELCAADISLYPMLAHLVRYEKRRDSLGLTAAIGTGLRKMMDRVEAQPYFDKTFPAHWR